MGIWKTASRILYVDDMAKASVFVMQLPKEQYQGVTSPMQSHLNVVFGSDVSIRELVELIAKTIEYDGMIRYDTAMPDGAPQKLMDSSRLNQLGWKPLLALEDGLYQTYKQFKHSVLGLPE